MKLNKNMDKESFAIYRKNWSTLSTEKDKKVYGPFATREEAQIVALNLGYLCYVENMDRHRYNQIISDLWNKYRREYKNSLETTVTNVGVNEVNIDVNYDTTTTRTTTSTTTNGFMQRNGYTYLFNCTSAEAYGRYHTEREASHNKESFINELKTNPVFRDKWGLFIEERILSSDDRVELGWRHYVRGIEESYESVLRECASEREINRACDDFNIPIKLYTITYEKETIEVYE